MDAARISHKGLSTLEQEVMLDQLPVRGTLPAWLTGTLVRNGPAQFEVGSQAYTHWFDGLGMLHKFAFRDGAVSYANKFLKSKAYQKARETGKISYTEFATDPCRTLFQRMFTLFTPKFSDNAVVNITRIADRFVALTEVPIALEFDVETLETIGIFDYEDTIGGHTTTAHPHYDLVWRSAINFVTQFSPDRRYNVYRIPDGSAQRRLIASIPVSEPAYMHSFAMTERSIILTECPFVADVDVRNVILGKPFINNLKWKPERGTRFTVIRKEDGAVRTFETEAFATFHHVNAFEHAGEIVIDLAAYPDASVYTYDFYLEQLRSATQTIALPNLRRYRLCLHNGHVAAEALAAEPLELPCIDYGRYNGQPYQLVYGVNLHRDRPQSFYNQLVKVAVQTGDTLRWYEEDCFPGEPVFVRAPAAAAEDDGVILSVVLDGKTNTSFLLVLDAATFTELARAEVAHHIPFGFHGQFFGDMGVG
jgi:carotenoid cleavage dioxygenase-like enzyme